MPLQIDYVTPSTGATASYHVVHHVGLDYESKLTTVTIASFLNRDTRDAGKYPMYTQQIQVSDLPGKGVDARDFAESSLVKAPASEDRAVTPNRSVFVGAEIQQ